MNISSPMRQFLIFIIVVAQVFSPVTALPIIGEYGINAFRVILLLLFLYFVISKDNIKLAPPVSYGYKICVALIFVIAMSFVWAYDLENGIRIFSYFITIYLLIFILPRIVYDDSDLNFFSYSILLVGLLILIASYYEFITGQHFFRSSLQDSVDLDPAQAYILENLAWFTFDNPNDLAVHLAFSFIPIVWLFKKHPIYIIGVPVYFMVLMLFLDVLGARLSMLGLAFYFISVFIISMIRYHFTLVSIYVTLLFLTASSIILSAIYVDSMEFVDISTFIRMKLLESAIAMSAGTYFIGIGVGDFEIEMWSSGFIATTYGIVSPHNAFGRILAENGVIGLSLFICLVFFPAFFSMQTKIISKASIIVVSGAPFVALLLSSGSNPISSSSLQLSIVYLWIVAQHIVRSPRVASDVRAKAPNSQRF